LVIGVFHRSFLFIPDNCWFNVCSGSVSQHINVHSCNDGELRSIIKYHDGGGFMGHRIGAVSCLTFHPHHVCLAAGGMDQLISVFASEKIKK
jgi:regulator-associated protein of mTOR